MGRLAAILRTGRKLAAKATANGNKELAATLEQDREALSAGRSFPAVDRYLPLICPEETTAATTRADILFSR